MKSLRIIIAGGRDFDNYKILRSKSLAAITDINKQVNQTDKIKREFVTIISGAARGADSLGEQFAKEFELTLKQMPAQWEEHGRKAGYLRNAQMADFACEDKDSQGVLIAFWDGKSRGTRHMIDIAIKHGMTICVFDYEGNRIEH